MKLLYLIASALLSINSYAAISCDVNVTDSEITGVRQVGVSFQDTYKGATADEAALTKLGVKMLAKCQASGAENCDLRYEIKEYKNMEWMGKKQWQGTAIATGATPVGKNKLTPAEYAKKRQKLICEKLNTCIASALNDNESSFNFMQKLYLIKDQNNCQEIENIMFDN